MIAARAPTQRRQQANEGKTITADEERWAEAGAVLKWQGDRARVFVAERIGALADAGDAAGVERWKQIAAKLQQLIEAAEA